jgi:hypothetical protein
MSENKSFASLINVLVWANLHSPSDAAPRGAVDLVLDALRQCPPGAQQLVLELASRLKHEQDGDA